MTIELIRTKDASSEWYKVVVDNSTLNCISIDSRGEEEALKAARKLYDYAIMTKGKGYEIIDTTVL